MATSFSFRVCHHSMKAIPPRCASPEGPPANSPFPDVPFEQQVRIVMDHLKKLVEAAGSNTDCLLKVIVWLKDQRQFGALCPYLGFDLATLFFIGSTLWLLGQRRVIFYLTLTLAIAARLQRDPIRRRNRRCLRKFIKHPGHGNHAVVLQRQD
jgi:hypothetical protein